MAMKTKEELLRDGEYWYNYLRMVYVNRKARKVLSVQWVEEHSEQELASEIARHNDTDDWQFCFNDEPSDYVRDVLSAELDGRLAAH